ncbi:MAG: hypothetical protein WBP64_08440 [Nitrososphaeraceae archaeon]|jgi:hypothetical protein
MSPLPEATTELEMQNAFGRRYKGIAEWRFECGIDALKGRRTKVSRRIVIIRDHDRPFLRLDNCRGCWSIHISF